MVMTRKFRVSKVIGTKAATNKLRFRGKNQIVALQAEI